MLSTCKFLNLQYSGGPLFCFSLLVKKKYEQELFGSDIIFRYILVLLGFKHPGAHLLFCDCGETPVFFSINRIMCNGSSLCEMMLECLSVIFENYVHSSYFLNQAEEPYNVFMLTNCDVLSETAKHACLS